MNHQLMLALIVAIVIIVIVTLWATLRRRRTEQLRSRFGPEYDRTVQGSRTVADGEAALIERQTRVDRLQIHPLSPEDSQRFAQAWRDVQARFVDDPRGAIIDADRLVGDVMHARGYPVGDFEQRVADISVDHPNVVMNYRAARDIVQDRGQGPANTEDLRQAMVHFRALFADLLGAPMAPAEEPSTRPLVSERSRS